MNTLLEERNKHPRDNHISFDEGPHIYTIHGDSSFTSVTTWVHHHFEKFDADKVIANMMRSKNWSKNKYYGMTVKEIKADWDKNRDEAANAGTKMHYDIECYYNDMEIEVEEDCVEWQYFEMFEEEWGQHMTPYRTEWMIWDDKLKFAGSIDMTFLNSDGTIEIYDWKRSVGIKKENSWQSAITPVSYTHLTLPTTCSV